VEHDDDLSDAPGKVMDETGMTSTTLLIRRSWKWSAANFAGLPVASANMEGTSMDVFVVKIVRSWQSLLNWANTLPFSSGSSGTDSLTKSTSLAALAGSGVPVILKRL
jgi:hypothetical protein